MKSWPFVCAALAAGLPAAAPAADPGHGAELFRTHCANCHGHDGRPVLPGAPDLSRPTALLKPDPVLMQAVRAGRGAWVQIADGELSLNGTALATGDGASAEEPGTLTFTAARKTEALLFDLA